MATAVMLAPSAALAGCVLDVTGTIKTCSGDISGGVRVNNGNKSLTGNPATTATITLQTTPGSLTTNITPSSGNEGLALTSERAQAHSGTNGDPPSSAGHPDPGLDLTLSYSQAGADVTVSNSGAIITTNASGILVKSIGGNGGSGGDSTGSANGTGGTSGAEGGTVTVTVTGAISSSGSSVPAIVVLSVGGAGAHGGNSSSGDPGDGGDGGAGGAVTITASGTIIAAGSDSNGISAISRGGNSGSAGNCSFAFCGSSSAGTAAHGGTVMVTTLAGTVINTNGFYANGIYAASIGGFGGTGEANAGFVSYGGGGGSAGPGGLVTVTNNATITTQIEGSYGIFAQSIGGGGGGGGSSAGVDSLGGHGGRGGAGGIVNVYNFGAITTFGDSALGIFAQSIGGGGGNGGNSGGLDTVGGNGSGTSNGAAVTVTNTASISTHGASSQGIFAESIGGGGGNGGKSAGLHTIGGTGGGGGDADTVTVSNSGAITTAGASSQAIFAQSVGGGGGHGGASAGNYSVGGSGGPGGSSAATIVTNSGNLSTQGSDSNALFAQSVGGGGGNGGGSVAGGVSSAIAIGGKGGVAGDGSTVQVLLDGGSTAYSITTQGDRSAGIFAQSVGGGGGNGGMALAASDGTVYSSSASFGGKGGAGGAGKAVTVQSAGTIATGGANSDAIFAQSLGGGGGNGGFAISGNLGSGINSTVALGGDGGGGGNSGTVTVTSTTTISTTGEHSNGIVAQSVGGGGGNGGFAIAASAGSAFAATLSFGGKGAHGGASDMVTVSSTGAITTTGAMADGIFAQSLGGGGGNGGFSIAGSMALGSASIAVGGAAGGGNAAGSVSVTNSDTGVINTSGDHSVGIRAQSVGGGGGNGGFAITASGGVMSAAVSVGGSGAAGGTGLDVTVNNAGGITTLGSYAYGIQAQSIGGGGGNGGFALSGALGVQVGDVPGGAAAISIGGKGGGGSNSSAVTVDNTGSISTSGLNAHGIFAESVGGGGGSGGFAGAVSMTLGNGASFGVAVGGAGSGGGDAAAVQVTSGSAIITNTTITTHSDGAHGIFAQSVGGGGGDGGFGFAGAFGFGGETSVDVAVAIGGAGGSGGKSSTVLVDNYSTISTFGTQSNGIFAQSVGGGGGNGGMAISGTLAFSSSSGNTAVSVGGAGGGGNTASTVTVNNFAAISTAGMDSIGIFAQSVGGSGGNGGMALTAQMTGATENSATIGVAIGGGGGNGNSAGAVNVTNEITGTILTSGLGGHGIQAQSVGGGGGNGGMAVTTQLGISPSDTAASAKTLNVGVAVGGAGGDGGFGNTVHVINNGEIAVSGDTSMGIFAQSVGGGGGNGGGAVSAFGMLTDSSNTSQRSLNVNVAIGGAGGNGNHGGAVTVDNAGSITTQGVSGYGVFAQSVGGGGGIGGRANTFSMVLTNTCTTPLVCPNGPAFNNFVSLGASVGGNGGGASNGGTVIVNNTGRIETFGDTSDGIYAQSIGGGGGNGGNGTIGLTGLLPAPAVFAATVAGLAGGAVNVYQNLQVAVGGDQGSSGDGGAVSVDNNKNITTHGGTSNAITAQSIGGGGGIGGNAAIGLTGLFGLGGKGGAGGNGGDVTVNQHGGATIETFGTASDGIFAQSVGGGGGVAGSVTQLATPQINFGGGVSIPALNIGVGLTLGQGGGSGGDGGHVAVTVDGTILTHGDSSFGIYAQSVGGGGGAMGQLGTLSPWSIGGNGDAGNGGAVDVTLTGTIATSGNNATGIFAQSVAGTGTAGNVNVTLNSSVITGAILGSEDGTVSAPLRGLGSIGILAESTAVEKANDGNITINLNDSNGVVRGGRTLLTSPTAGSIGVGIWLVDGTNNTINNHGLVTTVSGTDGGYAILATGSGITPGCAAMILFVPGCAHPGGNETVNNFGTIVGSVDLGAGSNVFNNNAGALFSPGAVAFIGTGNTLTNDGTISPGTSSKAMTTALTGNFVQSSTGTYAVSIDFLPNVADRINVSGTTSIAGLLAVNPVNQGNAKAGSYQYTVLSSAGGTNHTGLVFSAPPSAVASYSLLYPNANDVVVAYNVNFNPAGLPANLGSIATTVNNIQAAGVPGFSPIAAALFNLPDTASLTAAYNALSGVGTVAAQQSAFGAGTLFTSSLLDQATSWFGGAGNDAGTTFVDDAGGALRYAAPKRKRVTDAFAQFEPGRSAQPDRWHAWMATFGGKQTIDGNSSSNTAGLSQTTYGGGFGVDRQMNKDFLLGFAVGATRSNFSVSDRATSGSLDGGHFGVYGVIRRNAWYVAGSLSYARFDNDINRTISGVGPAENANGKFTSNQFSGRLEIGRRSEFGRFAVTPFTAVEFARLQQDGYSETSTRVNGGGPGILGLTYNAQTIISVPGSLGVQIESRVALANGMVLSPFARAAWVHEFQSDRQVTPSFNVAPGFTFNSSGVSAASDTARVNIGGSLRVNPHATLFASFNGEIASNTRSYGITGGYRIGW